MIFVRWRAGEPRLGRQFAPIAPAEDGVSFVPDHPCLVCQHRIGTRRGYQLLAIGPVSDDEEDRERHDTGRWYNAGAGLVHVDCTVGLTEADFDRIASECVVADNGGATDDA